MRPGVGSLLAMTLIIPSGSLGTSSDTLGTPSAASSVTGEAGSRPSARLSLITATATAGTVARRLGQRVIPHPADAVCLPQEVVAANPAKALNDVMEGAAGPVGQFGSGDIGGAVRIGQARQWIFALGDTLIGPNNGLTLPGGMTFVHNSFLVQDNNCFWVEWGGKSAGTPSSLIPDAGTSHYWPLDAYVHGNRLYQFVAQIEQTGWTSLFDFRLVDTDLAVFDLSTWDLEHPTIIEHGPWEGLDPVALEGVYNVETDNGDVVFGVSPHRDPSFYGMIRLTDPGNPTAPWQAWNGSTWSELGAISAVLRVATSDSSGMRPFQYANRWYAMAFSWTAVGIDHRLLTADSMTGPYTEILRVPSTPLPGAPVGSVQYWHTLEGDYTLGPGHVLMQWANNGPLTEGALLRYLRPTFTAFDMTTRTAQPVG